MRHAGGIRSANADMSNDNASEKLARRKPKGSCATLIDAGLVGPKARPKGVVDGKLVNIPVLCITAMRGRRRLNLPGVGCPGESM